MASQLNHFSISDVISVLHNLPVNVAEDVVVKLRSIGVELCGDLQFVAEQDLVPTVNPIMARRLVNAWTEKRVPLTPRSVTSSTENTDSLPPVSSASSPPVSSASSTPTTSAELSSPAFHIPWSKMPANLMTSLAKKERPTPALRREMVRIICSDIVTTCANPGRRQLRLLADKIVDTYPLSFRDMLDGDVVGSGYDSLMLQLESRLDNLNRGKLSVKRRLSENSSESPESVQSTKICPRDYYGCISWQPILPSGDDLMDLKSKQAALKCLASEANPDMVLLKELMQQTYCLQRADINMGMNAAELQEAWPSLFTALGIATHFEQLTEIPLLATMTSAMDRKAATIVDFLKSSSKKCAPVLLRLDEAKAELGNNSPMVVGILLLLASHFGENADSLVLSRDIGCSVPSGTSDLPTTPCLIAFGSSALTAKRFVLAVNRVVVLENITCPSNAVSLLFAMFYVLNLHYSENSAITLEFIQRSFAGINPSRGTKTERHRGKSHCIHPKLLKLSNELRDFTNQWAI